MGVFRNNAVTDAGRVLLSHVQMGAVFTPTRIVMGSGDLPAGTTVRTITAVVAPVQSLTINKKRRANDGTVTIGGVYSNQDISTDFYFRELALYAMAVYEDGTEVAEVLYSYGNAGSTADLMPAYTSGQPVERQIDLVTYIGNDSEVDLTIASGVHVTWDEANESFVSKTGDTMTGDLHVSGGVFAQEIRPEVLKLTNYGVAAEVGQYIDFHVTGEPADTDYMGRLHISDNGEHIYYNGKDLVYGEALITNTTFAVGSGKAYATIQAAIDACPKDLGGFTATIYIDAGTYTENLTISGFVNGDFVLRPSTETRPTIIGKTYVGRCTATVHFRELDMTANSAEYVIASDYVPNMSLSEITISGTAKGLGVGIRVSTLTNCIILTCTFKQLQVGVFATYGGKIAAYNCNVLLTTQAYYASCGTIQISGGTVSSDADYTTDHGGRIYSGAQASMPNY